MKPNEKKVSRNKNLRKYLRKNIAHCHYNNKISTICSASK